MINIYETFDTEAEALGWKSTYLSRFPYAGYSTSLSVIPIVPSEETEADDGTIVVTIDPNPSKWVVVGVRGHSCD